MDNSSINNLLELSPSSLDWYTNQLKSNNQTAVVINHINHIVQHIESNCINCINGPQKMIYIIDKASKQLADNNHIPTIKLLANIIFHLLPQLDENFYGVDQVIKLINSAKYFNQIISSGLFNYIHDYVFFIMKNTLANKVNNVELNEIFSPYDYSKLLSTLKIIPKKFLTYRIHDIITKFINPCLQNLIELDKINNFFETFALLLCIKRMLKIKLPKYLALLITNLPTREQILNRQIICFLKAKIECKIKGKIKGNQVIIQDLTEDSICADLYGLQGNCCICYNYHWPMRSQDYCNNHKTAIFFEPNSNHARSQFCEMMRNLFPTVNNLNFDHDTDKLMCYLPIMDISSYQNFINDFFKIMQF